MKRFLSEPLPVIRNFWDDQIRMAERKKQLD